MDFANFSQLLGAVNSHGCWVWNLTPLVLSSFFLSRKCFSSQLWKDHPDCGCASDEVRVGIWVVVPRLHRGWSVCLGGLLFPIGLNKQVPFGYCLKVCIEFLSEVWGCSVLDLAPRIVRRWACVFMQVPSLHLTYITPGFDSEGPWFDLFFKFLVGHFYSQSGATSSKTSSPAYGYWCICCLGMWVGINLLGHYFVGFGLCCKTLVEFRWNEVSLKFCHRASLSHAFSFCTALFLQEYSENVIKLFFCLSLRVPGFIVCELEMDNLVT